MTELSPETAEHIARAFVEQRLQCDTVRAGTARDRIEKLKRLRRALLAHRSEVRDALYADLRKAPTETDLTEILPATLEIQHAIRHVRRWMKPNRARTPLLFLGTRSEIRYDSKGVVLIIAPWNYSVLLTLGPLVSAIAAGNCAIIKPSEYTPRTSAAIARIVRDAFDENEVTVIEGNVAVAQALLQQPFDHIFFTGSPGVGREIMKAAATHLCSVTLELGGKSPALVDDTFDVEEAATKIAYGKWINAGQTCIAPDYVLVHRDRHDALVEALTAKIRGVYGTSAEERAFSPHLTGVVDERHFERLKTLAEDAVAHGARIAAGGFTDAGAHFAFEPTLLTKVAPGSAVLREEIFGPILPIVPYDTLDEAIRFIRGLSNPLIIYLFSRRRDRIERLLRETWAGSTLLRDTLISYAQPELPFGGVNMSGMGRAHGRAGFLAFSNERPVMTQRLKRPLFQLLYPPYTERTRRLIDLLLRYASW